MKSPTQSPPPDTLTTRLGVLTRREVEARILAPVIDALGDKFGRDEVVNVVRDTIINIAQEQGGELAEAMGGNDSQAFLDSLQYWTKDDALVIDLLEQNEEKLSFNVVRCRYAELYKALGIPELGAVLSCNRDFALIDGFNEKATLTRTQTIMEGAEYCNFRYTFQKSDLSDDAISLDVLDLANCSRKIMIQSRYVDLENIRMHYTVAGPEIGTAPIILFLHGWPTSSYLWRHIQTRVEASHSAIALDLPGYGQSDKPANASYSLRFYEDVIDKFLQQLNIDQLTLAVHDLGGPVGLYWARNKWERVEKLVLFNTLVYPKMSWAVIVFALILKTPLLRDWLTSSSGLKFAMNLGIQNKEQLTDEMLEAVRRPFLKPEDRQGLIKSIAGIHPQGMVDLANGLKQYKGPIQIIYGKNDRILPDVQKTFARVAKELPQTKIASIANCGHFLQEDKPKEAGELLAQFLLN